MALSRKINSKFSRNSSEPPTRHDPPDEFRPPSGATCHSGPGSALATTTSSHRELPIFHCCQHDDGHRSLAYTLQAYTAEVKPSRGAAMFHSIEFNDDLVVDLEISPKLPLERVRILKGTRVS